jgi:hypothetical protein
MAWSEIRTFIRDKAGRVLLNPAKQFVRPFELSVDLPNQIITLAPGERRGPFPLTAQYDGPIEVFYVKAVVYDSADSPITDYNIRWLLEHPGKRVQFMPRAIKMMPCVGDGGRPYVLPETIFIPAVQSLNVTLFNDDLVNSRKVELVLGGVKYYPNSAPQEVRSELFQYVDRRDRTYTYWQPTEAANIVPASPLAGSADFLSFFTVPDDADLEIFKLTAQSTGPFRCKINDAQNDRGVTGAKIHSSLLFGGHQASALLGIGGSGGILPARWASTFIVQRSVKMQITLDNLVPVTNEIEVVFGGRKISYA